MDFGISNGQSASWNWIIWGERCSERQPWFLSPNTNIDGLVHSCRFQAFPFMLVEDSRQGTECLLLLWNQGRTRLEKWAAEVNRIMFAHLPTHPGIYNLPVSISLSASSGLEVGWGREASSNGRCFKTVPGFPESLMRSSHFQIGGHEYEVIPLPNRQKDLSNVQKNPSLSKAWIFFLLKEGFLRWG